MTAIPDWLVPPYEGWHFDDLLTGRDRERIRRPASGTYVVTGIFHDRLRLPVPFPVDLDLAELTR